MPTARPGAASRSRQHPRQPGRLQRAPAVHLRRRPRRPGSSTTAGTAPAASSGSVTATEAARCPGSLAPFLRAVPAARPPDPPRPRTGRHDTQEQEGGPHGGCRCGGGGGDCRRSGRTDCASSVVYGACSSALALDPGRRPARVGFDGRLRHHAALAARRRRRRVGVQPMLATAYAVNAVSVSVPLAGPALATAFTSAASPGRARMPRWPTGRCWPAG